MRLQLGISDRRGLLLGFVALVAVAVVYPLVAERAGHPLSIFVLPGLFCAILGGWRPTLVVGAVSMASAVVVGLDGPLEVRPLVARWAIVGIGTLMGGIGAFAREVQGRRLDDLGETAELREAFERALFPTPVPPPGLVAISRFVPAESRLGLGGDFFEAVGLPDGRLAVLIGDVCGHGPREAAFGTALRAGWKAIALGSAPDPGEWLDALDMTFFNDGRMPAYATICTGYFDLEASVARLANAGHLPPLRLGESVQALALPPAAALGMGIPRERSVTEIPWLGEPIIFYTDGLVENPSLMGAPQRWGEEGLRRWIAGQLPATDPHRLINDLMADATAGREMRDDVAVLLVAADH